MNVDLPPPLAQALDLVRCHPQVCGVLSIGSLTKDALTPDSDYDLVFVMDEMEPLWYVGVTRIGGRFTDLIYVSSRALDEIEQTQPLIPETHSLVPIVRWLEQGKIFFDRQGQLRAVQKIVQARPWVAPTSDEAVYGAWFAINFNLAVLRRLAASGDSLYRATAEIRAAVYGHSDLWFNYFTIRKLSWDGDKSMIRYLMAHDPQYLDLYRRFIAAQGNEKFALYERVAARATEPLGGLWTEPLDVANLLSPPWTWQDLAGVQVKEIRHDL